MKTISAFARRRERDFRTVFHNRRDAGKRLAALLAHTAGSHGAVALALPRGGVPVAYEIATAFRIPLDVFEVRKLGAPGQSELAMGAIGSGGAVYLNEQVIEALGVSRSFVRELAQRERSELKRREALYREGRGPAAVGGRRVLLVDDGIATGATMQAAVKALRAKDPAAITVAVPVAPAQAIVELRAVADEVVCAITPGSFYAVGSWYHDFRQVDDGEVHDLLRLAAMRSAG